ncbi:hypothetical protein BTO05_05445 [Winogradskyella sp. PC-19]|uniref:T9SS type B sorting domain-containing protein n=2 Tax=unclassified Winogradskyella TaxID=2615021 RepID=UPI000B3BE9A3|nr:T9SS type B sorting domain-containing protein [Winogradskyella sp. PC-19]ARV09106.1 hypothetical protein BTO05_05445 [Winogradskyella sp. PC-19]
MSPNSGTYLVTVTDAAGCIDTDDILINYAPIPVANPVDDQIICDDDNDGFWDFDFTTFNATVIGTQTDVSVSYHNTLADAQNNASPIIGLYTNMNAFTSETIFIRIENNFNTDCFDTIDFEINVIDSDVDASFTLTPTCDGGTAIITGDTGGTFAFNPVPTDGAVLDTTTGEVTGGTSGTTYTVEYTVSGVCTQTLAQDVTVIIADDASFTVTPTCDGGTVTITGLAGGTFAFNPVPTDGAVIDAATGEVTGGTFGTTYTIEYTTSGTCPSVNTEDVTVLTLDDSSFTMTATCDGGTATITGDTGGTFVLNPVPTDGAVIDAATGEVTNGTSAAIYTIEYTTAGACQDTSSQDVTVLTADDPSFTMTPTCDGGTATITGDTGGIFTLNPVPTDGAVIDSATGEVTGGTSATTYTIEYTTAGTCPQSSTQDVTVLTADDPSFTMTPTCDGGTATVTGLAGGTFTFNPTPTDGAVIDTTTGEVTGGTSGTTYTIEYTTVGTCPQTLAQDVTVIIADDASFTVTPTCDGGTVTITGLAGGTFAFNPVPTDGAVIDAATGEVTGGTFGTTYTIEYTTSGTCPSVNTEDVTVLTLDDSSFTMTATCDGGTATITGDAGGTFVLNPVPTDGAVIDADTGEVTNGTSAATYTIEYTTAGSCPDTSSQDVTVLTADDPSFTMTPTCDGGTATITGDTGGIFTLNPVPTDGAVIDSATGEVTGGTSATTYTIEYTTAGTCPQSSTQDVTVLTADDPSFTMTPTCDGGTATVTGLAGGTFTFNPTPTDGAVIDTTTGEVTGGTSGTTYTIEYTTVGTCPQTLAQDVTVITADDASFTVTPTCDGGTVTITGLAGGTFAFNPVPTDGAVIDAATGEVTGGTFGTTYTIEYTTSGTCPSVNTEDVTVLTLDDSSFTMTATCDGGTATITGDAGGTFVLNPVPTDGAVIDADTGEVTNGTSAATYTIEYTTAGACPDTSSQDVTVLTADDPSFTMTPTCDGGTAIITGDIGGIFTLNPVPTDGAVIDSATGEVTGGTSATTYTIEYTTAGTCPQSSTQDVTVTQEDDASFTVAPTCDGGLATITGLAGGTFTFNPTPTDSAVIDATTGEVTGGTPGAAYTIEYSVSDVCPNSSTVTFNANPLPDDSVVVTDFLECENNTDFLFEFDLESKDAEILNGQESTLFTVTYHDSQADADNLVDALVSPYENTSNPQPIFVAITNNMTGCSVSTQSFNIEVLDGAFALDDFYEECDVVGDNDGSTQFDLESRIPNIIGTQDLADISISFHFSEEDALNDEEPLPLLYENFVNTNPQTIYARVSSNIRPDECFEIAEVTLQTNLLPIFDLDDTYTLCLSSNDEAEVPIPPVIDTELSDADYTFEWSFNGDVLATETGSSLIPTQGGTYSVLVTDTTTSTVTMCTNFDETVVVEGGIPDSLDVEVVSQTFTGNNMIVATATGNSEYEYSLDNGPWELSGEFENVTGGEHLVAVRDVLGCGILYENITVIDYPKFFTPNGDGNNDTWTIRGIDSQPAAVIYIHDRYGKLLKQLSPTSPGWDGTYNGNNMPSSDYWFTLEYNEPINDERRTFTAHFALKR